MFIIYISVCTERKNKIHFETRIIFCHTVSHEEKNMNEFMDDIS